MRAVGRYDTALQMFVEETREPDLRRLTFLRWLAEKGRLEHSIAGKEGITLNAPNEGVLKSENPQGPEGGRNMRSLGGKER